MRVGGVFLFFWELVSISSSLDLEVASTSFSSSMSSMLSSSERCAKKLGLEKEGDVVVVFLEVLEEGLGDEDVMLE